MVTLRKAVDSTVSRKYIMGLSGLGLVGFVIVHLLGNLNLLLPGSTHFNAYAEKLHSFGSLLTVAEFGLLFLVLLHVVSATRVTTQNRAARPEKYEVVKSKGAPSRSNISSRNMFVTGSIIFAFLILHIWQFRFGAGIEQGYVTSLDGKEVRDLYRLVSEVFHNPFFVAVYVGVMILLGLHFRHGFWSSFQSLGAMSPKLSRPIWILGAVIAFFLALGFLTIPVWFYFGLGGA